MSYYILRQYVCQDTKEKGLIIMNIEKISQKINDLEYCISLDTYAIERADYNIKFAKRLGYDQETINNYIELSEYYSRKIEIEKNTCSTLKNYCKDVKNGWCAPTSDYLFKCTLPYEKVDELSNYQTSFTVDADTVKLFANGVDYNDIISCMDNSDIRSIETKFKSSLTPADTSSKEVAVELTDIGSVPDLLDEPITVKTGKNSSYKGLIASSKIDTCYPLGKAQYKDLNGDTYYPGIPTFEDITGIQTQTYAKQHEYDRLHNIETVVKNKMDVAISKMDTALSAYENQ